MQIQDIHYLSLLAEKYKNQESASAEIINLQAILNLPKGTEHFLSDIHGEYGAFNHVLRNGSGVIKDFINRTFGASIPESEKKTLATLIYYPEEKLKLIKSQVSDMHGLYASYLRSMVHICRVATSKYTRSKVRKALKPEYAYIIEELLHEDETSRNKYLYYGNIIETIIRLGRADDFICEFAYLIRRFAIDRLHVIGDIFDRGHDAARIMDMLIAHHAVDIEWGNHDISWMGAAAGCEALILNVIRIQARYATLSTLEEDYGINLVPLATFALATYKHDKCLGFIPDDSSLSASEQKLIAKIHKAVTVMQLKCEAQIIVRNPQFAMNDRIFLDGLKRGRVTVGGVEYEINDANFPTLNEENPFELTEEEKEVIAKLKASFIGNDKLKTHIRFLFSNGSIYRIFNSNLLFHGSIPLNSDGTLKAVNFRGKMLSGKAYLDEIDKTVREGYFTADEGLKRECLDNTWYLWCGKDSPLFGKDKMATFESYFINDKKAAREEPTLYYTLRNKPEIIEMILENFGLNASVSHIINGHVPVKVVKGESPVKADGKLFVIDGGFSQAYRSVTGIAGYTLIYNSHGLVLVAHEPFESIEVAVRDEKDIHSSTVESLHSEHRIRVEETDVGKKIQQDISDLEDLLYAYQNGIIKESIK